MRRIDLIRDLKEYTGSGVISRSKLCKYLQKSRSEKSEMGVDRFLEGLDYIPDGRGRKYFIPDVADKIIENTVKQ